MAKFFSKFDSERIVAAIAAAEEKSTGEVRVHVTRRKPENLEERALRRFHLLGMAATRRAQRGAPLHRSHGAAVPDPRRYRDPREMRPRILEGNRRRPWRSTFARGGSPEGVLAGIGRVGDALARHFPRESGDTNELSDEVTED